MDLEVINFIKDNFLNPQKRIFIGYLFSGFFIAFLWVIFFKKISITNAINNDFDVIELDVQLTKDNIIILHHDLYINWSWGMMGQMRKVRKTSFMK